MDMKGRLKTKISIVSVGSIKLSTFWYIKRWVCTKGKSELIFYLVFYEFLILF